MPDPTRRELPPIRYPSLGTGIPLTSGRGYRLTLDLTSDILEEIARNPSPPRDLLADLDAAGLAAAKAFDEYICRVEPGKGMYELKEATLRRGTRLFVEAVEKHEGVPRSAVSTLRRLMPRGWGRFIPDGREGRLSYALFLMEGADKVENEPGGRHSPARHDRHPVLAYLDDLGKKAVETAVKKYKSKLPREALTERPIPGFGSKIPPDVYRDASKAALKAFLETFAKVPAHDLWEKFQSYVKENVPPALIWTFLITAGAGALASLVLAPRAVYGNASALGMKKLGFSKDFEVYKSSDGKVRVKLGGSAYILPDQLAEGFLWEQTSAAFQVSLRASVSYGPLTISGNVGHAGGQTNFGVMVSLKIASF